MKRWILAAALAASLPVQAQWYDDDRPDREVARLQSEIDRLADDERVLERAPAELERAERYVERLADEPGDTLDERDLAAAERLIARVESVAYGDGYGDEPAYATDERDEDWEADPRWRERDEPETYVIERDVGGRAAREARRDAARERDRAEAEREAALAARLEAEHARNANARLREELGRQATRETDRGLVLTLGDVLFAVGKAELKPGAKRTLDKLVAAMKRDRETTVVIEGHTDSTGQRAFNLGLSQRRANAVRAYLTAKGIPAARIDSRGLGPDYPVATNATEAGRQQNRRVEVLVQNDAFED